MKNIEGYEQTDYFSQETILDYIDGRLSPRETIAFEQQMQQDESLQLAVDGIKGFYLQEQKDRGYLENMLVNSEEALKGVIAQENTKMVKLAARRRQNIMGITMAACVALLMVFSVPYLLDNVNKDEGSKGIAVADTPPQKANLAKKSKTEKKAKTTKKEEDQAAEAFDDDLKEIAQKTPVPNQNSTLNLDLKTTRPKASPEEHTIVTEDDKKLERNNKNIRKPGAFSGKKRSKKTSTKKPSTRPENTIRTSKESVKLLADKQIKTPLPTGQNAGYTNAGEENKGYRVPGKLYLWVFTDKEDLGYDRLVNMGNQIASSTGLKLVHERANTAQFRRQQWRQMLQKQRVSSNDVVWVYYMGKLTTRKTYRTKSKDNNTRGLKASLNSLNNTLANSPANLKLVMVDEGNQNLNNYRKYDLNVATNQPIYSVQSKAQRLRVSSNTYKKLFLGSSGIVTRSGNKAGRNAYQGVFTNALVNTLKTEVKKNRRNIDWKAVLRTTEKETRRQNRRLIRANRTSKVKPSTTTKKKGN